MLSPLKLASGYLKKMGCLDLSEDLPESLRSQGGEIGSLVHSVSKMKQNLTEIIREILAVASETIGAVNRVETVHDATKVMAQNVAEGAEASSAIAGSTSSITVNADALQQEARQTRNLGESLQKILSRVRL